MVVKSSSIVQVSVISALLLVSVLSIIQAGTAQTGKFTADLQPRAGSNATGKATLEAMGDEPITYTITATGLSNNITNVAISQDTGSGRAPDVVTLRERHKVVLRKVQVTIH